MQIIIHKYLEIDIRNNPDQVRGKYNMEDLCRHNNTMPPCACNLSAWHGRTNLKTMDHVGHDTTCQNMHVQPYKLTCSSDVVRYCECLEQTHTVIHQLPALGRLPLITKSRSAWCVRKWTKGAAVELQQVGSLSWSLFQKRTCLNLASRQSSRDFKSRKFAVGHVSARRQQFFVLFSHRQTTIVLGTLSNATRVFKNGISQEIRQIESKGASGGLQGMHSQYWIQHCSKAR